MDGLKLPQVLIDALCCIMCADGTVTASERQALSRILQKLRLSDHVPDVDTCVTSFTQRMQTQGLDVLTQQTARRLAAFAKAGKSEVILKCLAYMAKADGTVDARESEVCRQFKRSLDASNLTSVPPRGMPTPDEINDELFQFSRQSGPDYRRVMDADRMDKGGQTALHRAVRQGDVTQVQALLSSGADPNIEDWSGYTALALATERGDEHMVDLLLHRGADLNVAGGTWGTVLHIAAERGHERVADLLLRRGADVNALRNGQTTPLECAVSGNHKGTARLLLQRGAGFGPYPDSVWRAAGIHQDSEMRELLEQAHTRLYPPPEPLKPRERPDVIGVLFAILFSIPCFGVAFTCVHNSRLYPGHMGIWNTVIVVIAMIVGLCGLLTAVVVWSERKGSVWDLRAGVMIACAWSWVLSSPWLWGFLHDEKIDLRPLIAARAQFCRSSGFEDLTAGEEHKPYVKGKVAIVNTSSGLLELGMQKSLDTRLRATRPDEVGTVVQVTEGLKQVGQYVVTGNTQSYANAMNGRGIGAYQPWLAIDVIDWKRQAFVKRLTLWGGMPPDTKSGSQSNVGQKPSKKAVLGLVNSLPIAEDDPNLALPDNTIDDLPPNNAQSRR